MKTKYTKKQKDILELITHLILTKPVAVKKLLAKHGVIFSFNPKRRDLINEVIELLRENNRSFNNDLERLLSIHLEHKGVEIMALESERALLNKEDMFLGGLIGGVAKGALGALGGLFGGGKKGGSSSGGGNAAAAAAAANAARAKAEMDARMRQMEADRRRQQEEADRRRREAEERQRREREAADRRRREEEERRRRAEMEKSSKGDGKSGNNNMMIIGGIAAVVVIGGIVAISMSKKPTVVASAA